MQRLFRRAVAFVVVGVVFAAAAGASEAATPLPRLLAMYQPVTHFDPLEKFRPASVQSFIADSDLERLTSPNTWSVVNSSPEPGDLPAAGTGIWRLNQDSCTPGSFLGGLDCYTAAWNEGSGGPVVYGHAARDGDHTVLEYWFFYYDDVYSYAYPPSNFIWQAHEGDWEVANVVLDENDQPVSTAYSQHCLGQTRAWTATPKVDGTHPIVYVALGSHANYFTAGTHPINLACVPPPALVILNGLGLPPPADHVLEGSVIGPPTVDGPATPIHVIGEDTPWVGFDGFWGELQYFHAPAPINTVPFGTSPVGPAQHPLWSHPMATIAVWPDS
jgi:hypothetical protein